MRVTPKGVFNNLLKFILGAALSLFYYMMRCENCSLEKYKQNYSAIDYSFVFNEVYTLEDLKPHLSI